MAHQLDLQTGSAAFVSRNLTAWHGLGTVIEQEMTVEEALKFAHLDFHVEKLPNTHQIPGLPDIVSNKSFFTYRTDTNFVLGDRLGDTYEVVQNAQALGVVDGLVKEGLIVETAGSLRNGCTVFICCQIPESIRVGMSDEVKQYLVIATGHDGATAILAYFTNVRVVCNNTLQLSFKDATKKYSVRHTASAGQKLDEALKLMGFVTKNQKAVQEQYNRLAQTELSGPNFWDYVGNVFFTAPEIKALQDGKKAAEVISTRKQNVVDKVLAFAQKGVGQAEAGPGSAWWAYNAVTGYFTHKGYDDNEKRMESLLFGSAADTMEKALVLATNPDKIQPLRKQAASFSAEVWN